MTESYQDESRVRFFSEADTTLIVIRGTSSLQDWRTNLNIRRTRIGEHQGFRLAANEIKTQVFNVCHKNKFNNFVIVGHSAGGAIAEIIASDLIVGKKLKLITLGQPRAGGSKFNRFLKYTGSRKYRFVYGDDPIPHSVPWWLGYRHYGEAIKLFDRHPYPFDGIEDHSWKNYAASWNEVYRTILTQ